MHASDLGTVERGDMGWNRKAKPDRYSFVFKLIGFLAKAAGKKAEFEKFKPDLMVDEGFDLSLYGLEAKIIHLPGHSKGSIGVLTEDGKLCCGDFAYNMPGFQFVDDRDDQRKSMDKVKRLKIETLYPGHGKPFPMKSLLKRS
jgi:hydroxyacylglutathione hydrolase